MNSDEIKFLYDYHKWANQQVWACAKALSDEQFEQAHDFSQGSVKDHLVHLVGSDWFTTSVLQGALPDPKDPTAPRTQTFANRAALRERWDAVDQKLSEQMNALSDEEWHTPLSLPTGPDSQIEAPPWQFFAANVNHGTGHRGELLALIHQLGGKTVEQGLFFYMMSQ